jgi:hypothetical protein
MSPIKSKINLLISYLIEHTKRKTNKKGEEIIRSYLASIRNMISKSSRDSVYQMLVILELDPFSAGLAKRHKSI